jgi:hypothetical protein
MAMSCTGGEKPMIKRQSILESLRRACRELVVPAVERWLSGVRTWSEGADQPGTPSVAASTPASIVEGLDEGGSAKMTPRQREVARSLSERDLELARWFTSTVALAREQQPAAWPELLAHLGRDLMNRMPEYFDLPRPPRIDYAHLVGRLVAARRRGPRG